MTRTSPSRLRAGALAAVALVAVATSGCSVSSPHTTHLDYDPADGVSADVSGVAARNLVAVAGQSGTVLSGTLVSTAQQPLTVGIRTSDSQSVAKVELKPGSSVRLDQGQTVRLPDAKAKPGSVLPVVVAVLVGGQPNEAVLSVPVLPAEGIYATVTGAAQTH